MGLLGSLFGGSGSKSTSTQTNQSQSRPWEFQAPYLAQGYGSAEQLYGMGGPQYYQGETVAGFSPVTEAGLNQITNTALQGNPLLQQGQNYLSGQLQGNYTPNPTTGFAGLNALASGPNMWSLNSGGFSASAPVNLADRVDLSRINDVNINNQHLQDVQAGNYLGSNPYLDQAIGAATGRVTRDFNNSVIPSLNATFGSGGRTGSGIHALSLNEAGNTLANNLGDMTSAMQNQAYQFERGQQDTAATNLMDAQLAAKMGNQGTRLGAEQANANLSAALVGAGTDASIASMNTQANVGLGNQGAYTNALNTMGNAAQNIAGNYFSGLNNMNNAASMIPTMQNANYFDANQLMSAGGMVDQKAQQYMDAQKAAWDYNQQQPYNMLDWYMNAIGAPVMTQDSYGTSTATSKTSSQDGIFGSIGLNPKIPGFS